jgi:acetate kinase
MHPNDADIFGVKYHDVDSVDIDDIDKPLTFKNVVIRVSDKFKLEMHIDTDESKAAEIETGEEDILMTTLKAVSLSLKNVLWFFVIKNSLIEFLFSSMSYVYLL